YSGIKPDSPIALATWRAEGSPRAIASGERKSVILTVRDRDRLERLLALYQRALGNFSDLPEYVSIGARFFGLAPALLPLGAAGAIKAPPKERKEGDLNYQLFASDECEGYDVKVIERRKIDPQGGMTADTIYLAYIGDSAVIASDWYSLRDVLRRLKDGKAAIGDNPDFKRAVARGGDAIYMSDLGEVFGALTDSKLPGEASAITESGSLRISNAAWENQYQLVFNESKWIRLLAPFKAGELAAPRELLPRSAVAYIFLSLDLAGTWKDIRDDLLADKDIKALASSFALDFEKDVLPEIGPEFGIALLALPDFEKDASVPWVIFFKLRSEKLAGAFRDGRLFKEQGGAAAVKIASTGMFAAVKNGFLVLSGDASSIERLEAKERLVSTRDYQRSVQNSPEGVIAFGGYNLEAATAHLDSMSSDPEAVRIISVMTSMARAFHSQTFYVTPAAGGAEARLSVSLDREGRYSVAELSSLAKDHNLTYAFIESRGAPVGDQNRLESLKIKIRAKGTGAIDRIYQDVASKDQMAEKLSDAEMVLTVRPRRASGARKAQLPVSGPEFAALLQPTREIRSDDKDVIARAREIAGDDRDAWSVARKLSDWTYKNLKWKRIDDADAAETLATREADCLEFSELFIAMARSLGLPARLVTGMAYDGTAFGGHAWVEVYAGEWIELDPTWGSDFVDATHIRSASGDLISYAALNLVDIEILEAPLAVLDYQRDPAALAETLCKEM
ncbi:MAG TPA: transglutaminase domain-containing protein, partial [Blastocatellia bacterium]|nr:transglutaminase domain-containing protein [Blastocatellia bacterium]